MPNTRITKVEAGDAPERAAGQKRLATGEALSMRLWEKRAPGPAETPVRRDYETVGYAIAGRAELTIEGQAVLLQPGSSWIVPRQAEHSFHILEEFTAVEATAPPAEQDGRDGG